MSTPTSSNKDGTNVEHSFDGDVRILNATFDRRHELRRALVAFAQDLQRIEGRPVHIKADIHLHIAGPLPKQHLYSIKVTDSNFDEEDPQPSPPRLAETLHTPAANAHHHQYYHSAQFPRYNRESSRHATFDKPMSSSGYSRIQHSAEESIDYRPYKRARPSLPNTPDLPITTNISSMTTPTQLDDILTYVKSWHSEWTSQGGWLFDILTKTQPTLLSEHAIHLEHKLDVVQDVLGQSLNAASATTMTELENLSKLVPWLEHCRKANADKVQAREEKWRTSSANFHDEARRDRERSEARLEAVVAEQGVLLARIAKAVGIVESDVTGSSEGRRRRSEEDLRKEAASLGAQLRRELSLDSVRSLTGRDGGRASARMWNGRSGSTTAPEQVGNHHDGKADE